MASRRDHANLEKLANSLAATSSSRPSSAKVRQTTSGAPAKQAFQRPATAAAASRRPQGRTATQPSPNSSGTPPNNRGGPRPGSSSRVRSAWKEQTPPPKEHMGIASPPSPQPTEPLTTATVEPSSTSTPLSVAALQSHTRAGTNGDVRATASSSPTKAAGSPSKAKAAKKATFGKSGAMVEPTAGPSGEITSLTEGEYQRLLVAWKEVDYTQIGVLPCAKVLDVLRWARLPVDVNLIQRLDRERKPQLDFMDFLKLCFPSISAHNRLQYAKLWGKPYDRNTRNDGVGGGANAWWAKFDPQALSELVQIYMLYARASSSGGSGGSVGSSTTSPRPRNGGSPRSEVRGISREALRAAIPRRNLDDATLNDIFTTYDVDQDNLLSLPEFAVVMEDVYLQPEKAAPEVRLFFQ